MVLFYSCQGSHNQYCFPRGLNADVVARLVLIPGASIGYHEHVGNEEVITVLSGRGRCVDDGEEYELSAGDVLICREHHHHGVVNTSDEDLVLMAVVIKS